MTKLVQLQNKLEIVGTLKSKQLWKNTSATNVDYISGFLNVSAKIDDEVHDFKVNVFTMDTIRSKTTYKGLEKVFNEYKSVEEHGESEADIIKVIGSLKLNSYKENPINNEIKGNFFSRTSIGAKDAENKAILSIGTVVGGFMTVNNRLEVNGFNVAYNEEIVEIKNMYVNEELEAIFKELFSETRTTILTCSLKCPSREVKSIAGFGVQTSLAPIGNNFGNLELMVIGGNHPHTVKEEIKYTKEMIELVKVKLEKESSKSAQYNF